MHIPNEAEEIISDACEKGLTLTGIYYSLLAQGHDLPLHQIFYNLTDYTEYKWQCPVAKEGKCEHYKQSHPEKPNKKTLVFGGDFAYCLVRKGKLCDILKTINKVKKSENVLEALEEHCEPRNPKKSLKNDASNSDSTQTSIKDHL